MNNTIDPFFMTTLELENWLNSQQQKYNDIHSLLSRLQFIPSLWKSNTQTFIISKSAKKENMLQLTCFNSKNIPVYDLIRPLNDIKDIVEDILTNECTIQQINYIK